MSSGTDATVEGLASALVAAASSAGLEVDASFTDADLASAAGPFVTMNVLGEDGTTITASVAVRDNLTTSEETLADLAAATAEFLGAGSPSPAGPIGTGSELSLRFAIPVTTTALTDGAEPQALIVLAADRRADGAATSSSEPGGGGDGEAEAARRALAGGGAAAPAGSGASGLGLTASLDKLVNVTLDVSVELGRTSVTLSEVLEYDVGSVIELDRAAGAPVDVRVNGMLLAQGEVVLIDDEYAVRITAIFDPQGRR
jgi:flagellar motor switch protein FliN/FliY